MKATLYLSRRNENTPSKKKEKRRTEGVMQGETTQDESLQSMSSESFLPQHMPEEQTAHLHGAKLKLYSRARPPSAKTLKTQPS